ncbi:hypothetical protein NLX69_16120 [Rossellomorea sp. BNER]|nr:hypothetical protein [Rossellomorea sp. BNER]
MLNARFHGTNDTLCAVILVNAGFHVTKDHFECRHIGECKDSRNESRLCVPSFQ